MGIYIMENKEITEKQTKLFTLLKSLQIDKPMLLDYTRKSKEFGENSTLIFYIGFDWLTGGGISKSKDTKYECRYEPNAFFNWHGYLNNKKFVETLTLEDCQKECEDHFKLLIINIIDLLNKNDFDEEVYDD